MSSSLSTQFELRGEYCGFIRTLLGKKRMVLRTGKEEYFLKVPKELRRHIEGTLKMGVEILVSGAEENEAGWRAPKRVVSEVRLVTAEGPVACLRCPIRVCTKKTCWRSGGKELWQALEGEIARRGLSEEVQLEGVHCLDHCKRGPNAEWQGHDFHHLSPRDAERLVRKVAGKDEEN